MNKQNDSGSLTIGDYYSATQLRADRWSALRECVESLRLKGVDGRSGHMGVVERVHEVDYDEQGRVQRVVFDGWEGRSRGAMHLTRRTWNRYGNPGGEDARGGFDSIHIIALRRPQDGARPERPIHENANASVHDAARMGESEENRSFSSSSTSDRPNESSETHP